MFAIENNSLQSDYSYVDIWRYRVNEIGIVSGTLVILSVFDVIYSTKNTC